MSQREQTFRTYTPKQAAAYADGRGSYPPTLYSEILYYHESTGGMLGTLLDCGCGPGNATRDLAPQFQHAMGIDHGEQMIETARSRGGLTASGEEVTYQLAGAEDLLRLPKGDVDVLTAAMAAHWFDMPLFWKGAAHVLNSGGTVALWTNASLHCHPATPNAAAVQKHLNHLESTVLAPYELTPNRISRDLYRNLAMPWNGTISPPVECFPRDLFVRKEWDVDGVLSNGDDFFGGSRETTLHALEASLGTASMVTRWREAHPDKPGTEEDCVRATMRCVREAMGLAPGEDAIIKVSGATALLMFKKV